MFDFDVNAVAAACEAALEQELVKIDNGYYIIDDETEAIVPEDEATVIDKVFLVAYKDAYGRPCSGVFTRSELVELIHAGNEVEVAERYGD